MRTFFVSALTFLLIFLVRIPVHAQTSLAKITTNLSLGSYGPQVALLQTLLNQNPETQVAQSGVGAPGNETEYFGGLTRAAVMRFQQKYRTEVLAPVGLTAPNGYVGFYTRVKLNALTATQTNPGVSIHQTAPEATTTYQQNQNNPNSQTFLNDITAAATAQGLPSEAIAIIKNEVTKQASSTTDMRASILQQFQQRNTPTTPTSLSFMGAVLNVAETVVQFFKPTPALAATGISFGGTLIFGELICNEESQYLIEITPGPPTYAVFLTYTPGSQLYSAYNIPFTYQILGSYVGPSVCVIGQCPYCYPFQTSGLITPQVGSTPLP